MSVARRFDASHQSDSRLSSAAQATLASITPRFAARRALDNTVASV